MNKYYLTFGESHKDRQGMSLRGCYTIIEAEKKSEARDIAFRHFNQKWAFLYDNPQEPGIIKYNLSYIPLKLLLDK